MNYNDITIGLVLFKRENVIHECLKSIKKVKKIIIFDNSNDLELKKKVIKKYPNIIYILSKHNIGYARGNNEIFKLTKSSHLLILNPDTILDKDCIKKLVFYSKKINNNFAILAPSTRLKNYGYFNNDKKKSFIYQNILDVDYVKGFAMLVNLSKIKKVGNFDDNFFLYLEEIDLCRRLKNISEKIYIIKDAKIKHFAAKSSNIGFEFEKCRNWHWMWSNVYYKKKYSNHLNTFFHFFPILFLSIFKMIFYFLIFKFKKSILNYMRLSGTFSALIGNRSWYRPN